MNACVRVRKTAETAAYPPMPLGVRSVTQSRMNLKSPICPRDETQILFGWGQLHGITEKFAHSLIAKLTDASFSGLEGVSMGKCSMLFTSPSIFFVFPVVSTGKSSHYYAYQDRNVPVPQTWLTK